MTDIDRVRSRIKAAILAFTSKRVVFRADELRAFVAQRCGATAPASADRILRDLRQRGTLKYVVVSRRRSLYRVLPVEVSP